MTERVLKNLLKSVKDPLKSGPEAGKELANRIAKMSDGFSKEHVIEAVSMIFVDTMRQSWPKREQAHAKLRELENLLHTLLDQHYDPVTGNRRSIFAFDQKINMVFTDDRKR